MGAAEAAGADAAGADAAGADAAGAAEAPPPDELEQAATVAATRNTAAMMDRRVMSELLISKVRTLGRLGLDDDASVDGYELIDAGDGGRLERFGTFVVERPAPGMLAPRTIAKRWSEADLRFDRDRGWHGRRLEQARAGWKGVFAGIRMELSPSSAGQVGLFPEHASMLPWLRDRVAAHSSPPSVLNLFAYTGLTTLVLAAAGAAVAHVDASRPSVHRARRNAMLNDLDDRPIRWLVDDAASFVAREVRRDRRYDGVILDPPTYGHGPSGRAWRLETDLAALLGDIQPLLAPGAFVLLTAHTEALGRDDLGAMLVAIADDVETGELRLTADVRCDRVARSVCPLARGILTAMPSSALASPSNPRIKAVARLRDRREREASGHTLIDGARELRRALDAGVDVVEAFVCEPLLAGEDARAALDALTTREHPDDHRHRARVPQDRVRRSCGGPRGGRPVPGDHARRLALPRRAVGRGRRGRREARECRRDPPQRRRGGSRRS